MYKQIQTLENYNILLKSGMFWEFHPELTGDWDKDKIIINGVGSLKNPKKENMEELTFGQKAVGLQFNPSGEDNVTKASELFTPSLAKILNRFYEEADRTSGLTLEIENNLQLISRYEEPTKECAAKSDNKDPNSYVDDMNNLISRLEVYNDRLAFSLRHIKELI